jgi:hypothetical protein
MGKMDEDYIKTLQPKTQEYIRRQEEIKQQPPLPPRLLEKMKDKLFSEENVSQEELSEWIHELEEIEDRMNRLSWANSCGESMGK